MKYAFVIAVLGILFLPATLLAYKENDHIFRMSEEGYEPKNLIIHIGDSVIFNNVSIEDRWPASNIHPTHEIYSEFDPGRPISPGASWEFRFDKAGIWKYHDHLAPSMNGTITVEENTAMSVPKEKRFFVRMKEFFSRFLATIFKRSVAVKDIVLVAKDTTALFTDDAILRSYIYTFRPAETIKRLHELSAQFGDCHQSAHKAGRFAYEFFKEKAFQECTAECHSGCYHGAIEAYFRDYGTVNLAKNFVTLCGLVTNPFFKHQCIHGIGHGLTAWNDYDIIEALNGCDLLPELRDSCYTGVFMENIVGGLSKNEITDDPFRNEHITTYLNDDPQFPCTVVDEKYKNACYFYQTSRMLKLFVADFKKIADTCSEAPEIYQSSCFQSMGRDAGGINRGNPRGAIIACANAPTGMFRQDCIGGAVQDLLWDSSGQDNAITFCKLLSDVEEKRVCYDSIFSRAPFVFVAKEDIKHFCEKVEKNYQVSCASSIDITP